jgi:hypothetical protein
VTGIRAELRGSHPGRGTHNALLALGPDAYLEILAPDPSQEMPVSLASIGLSETRSARMVAWAIGSRDLDGVIEGADAAGYPMTGPTPGEREAPDGTQLSWRTVSFTDPLLAGGLAPFFVDWTGSEHPASTAPKGAPTSAAANGSGALDESSYAPAAARHWPSRAHEKVRLTTPRVRRQPPSRSRGGSMDYGGPYVHGLGVRLRRRW